MSCDTNKLSSTNSTSSTCNILFPVDKISDKYVSIPNKRLTDVIKTVRTSSAFHCITWCSLTDGCLAVNVIGNHDTCELTTGLNDKTEMQDESASELLVLGMKYVFKNSKRLFSLITMLSANL